MQKIDVMKYIPVSREQFDQLGSDYIGASKYDVELETIEGINCAWVKVPNASADSIILHLHGGAYFQGSIKSHTTFASQTSSNSGINTLLPEFGLAPERPFPQGLNDVTNIYRYLHDKFKNIILIGDSSGGGLALSLIEHLRYLNMPLPNIYIGLYPWVDLRDEASVKAFDSIGDDSPEGSPLLIDLVNLYSGDESKLNPLISPLFADLSGYPPMLVQTGTEDFLGPQCAEFAQKAKEAGIDIKFEIYKDMPHGWHIISPNAPENAQAYESIARFIKKHVAARIEKSKSAS